MQPAIKKTRYSSLFVLAILSISTIFCTTTFSVMSTFYPILASDLLITPSMVGLVFSAFQVGVLIFGPIISLLSKVGMRFIFISSIFICTGSTFIFAFVILARDKDAFFWLSFAIRIFQGASFYGVQVSSMTIASDLFPNDLSKAVGVLEIANGLGYSVGPPIGGIFYQLSGFMMPFFIVSGVCFILLIFAVFLTKNGSPHNDAVDSNRSIQVMPLLKMYELYVGVLNLTIYTISYIFFDISLSPFITEHFNYKTSEIGLVFMGLCLTYSITGPIVGHFVDKFKNPAIYMALGCLINFFSFLFCGPSQFLNIDRKMWITVLCCLCVGVASALMYIPTMEYLLIGVRKNGMEDDLRMKNIMSGVITLSGGIGGLIGPIVGGIILEQYGFEYTCTCIAGLNLAMCAVILIFNVIPSRKSSNNKSSLHNLEIKYGLITKEP